MTDPMSRIRCTCCGIPLPVDNIKIPAELELHVRQLIREGKPVSAVKELASSLHISLGDAKFWVDHSGELIGRGMQTGPCPYCGKELRTDIAKQCRHCLLDWHDPSKLKRLSSN